MTLKAIIITGQESETESTLARNLIPVGGISLLKRQMLLLKNAGVSEVHLISDWFVGEFEKEILSLKSKPNAVMIHSTKDAPLKLLEHNAPGDSWLLLEEAVLLDPRIIDGILAHASPSAVSFIHRNQFIESKTSLALPLALEEEGFFGSVAKLSHKTLEATVRKLNSLEGLQGALLSISRAEDCSIYPLRDIGLYQPDRGQDEDLIWRPVTNRDNGILGTDDLLLSARRAYQSWPDRLINHPLASLLIKPLSKCPVQAFHLFIISMLLGMVAIFLLWAGQVTLGIFAALVVLFIENVTHKLAHLKMTARPYEKLEYGLSVLLEFGWYMALAHTLSSQNDHAPYILAGSLILFRLANSIQSEFFRRMTGRALYQCASFDQKFRIIEGGRSSLIWIFALFFIVGQAYSGFLVICLFGVFSFFVHQARFVYHAKNYLEASSETFVKNFQKTKLF